MSMAILTDAGKDHVDATEKAVEEIEEEVRERIEDALRSIDCWDIYGDDQGSRMSRTSAGEYLDRDAVLAAVRRGNW